MKQIDELDTKETWELKQLSVKICKNCTHWKSTTCQNAPVNLRNFRWTSLSICDNYNENETASLAGQIVVLRKMKEDQTPNQTG